MSKKSKKAKAKETSIVPDRPAGPGERETESGLIYGRWYGGAKQDCPNGCFGVPEGQHVPPCPLNTSKRAEPEAPDPVEEEADTPAETEEAA